MSAAFHGSKYCWMDGEVVETEREAWKPKAVLFTMPVQRLFRFADPGYFSPGFVK